MQDPRVAKCLAAKRESKSVEFKEQFSPTNAGEALELLKDLVAIANSGGGTIAIGIDNSGALSGADVLPVLAHDHAKYCDLIHKYTLTNFSDFEIIEASRDGKRIAIFIINAPDFPLVFQKPGQYAIDAKQQKTAFGQGTLYFRHGAKSEHGTTDDLRKFMHLRMREMEEQLLKGMRQVTESPRGAQLQVAPTQSIANDQIASVKIHLTTNPATKEALAIDRGKLCPYRQKEVIIALRKRLPSESVPTSHDIRAINKIYDIPSKPEYCWEPEYSSKQYSDAFIDWIAESIAKDSNFLAHVRKKLLDQQHPA
jgi:hypothetical protein